MPPLAIAGVASAVIGGGATLLASKSNSKAVKKASQTQAAGDAAALQFQQQARSENTANLSPWMQRGNLAGDTIMGALGLGGTSQTVGQAGALSPAQAATNAYELFKQSTGYQTRLDEGNRSLASNYFGGGVGQSGAAMKAAQRFGQGFASNEFGNWLGALGNQQNLGFGGASALAGVSQTFANNASNIAQNGANNQAQAAIAGAQNRGALYTGLAGIAGNAIGALSSYQQQAPPTGPLFGMPGRTVPHYGYG